MSEKDSLIALRQRYLARMAPRQVSPNARQFFVGVLTDEDMAEIGLDASDLADTERRIMEGCLKDGLIVRDLVLERGKEAVQPMGRVTPAGLKWAEANSVTGKDGGD